MNEETIYRDPTENNFPDDYDPSKVDSRIKLRTNAIRTKMYGKDVRGAVAEAAELSGVVSKEAQDASKLAQKAGNEATTAADNISQRFDEQIAGSTNDNEVIDARVSNKYGTFATLNDRIEKTEELTATLSAPAEVGGELAQSYEDKLAKIRSEVDSSKFNLLFITDVHYGRWSNEPQKLNNFTLAHLNSALYLDGKVDVIVAGGDNIDGWTRNKSVMLKEQDEFAAKLLGSGGDSDKFLLKGNHDDASGNLYQYLQGDFKYLDWLDGALGYSASMPACITDDELKHSYRTADCLYKEHRDGDSLYFYKDYPAKKVRLIGLDSNDVPGNTDGNGVPRFIGLQNMGYQQSQLSWLANDALMGVPDDYVTIIVGHIPANATGSDQHHQTIVNNIISAFQLGNQVTLTDEDEDWPVQLTANFTQQGPRSVAAYINGHLHQEALTSNLGFPDITVTSSINAFNGVNGNDDTDGWSLFSFDLVGKTIKITGFGRATDRQATF